MDGIGIYVTEEQYLSDSTLLITMAAGIALAALVYLVLSRPLGSRRRRVSGVQLGLLAGFTTLVLVLLFPAAYTLQSNFVIAVLLTLFLTIQCPTLNTGATDVVIGPPESFVGFLYYALLNLCYVVLPVLAVLNVYDLIGRRFSQLRCWLICRFSVRGRKAYVFSGLDERCVSLAQRALEEDARAVVIFTNVSRSERDDFNDDLSVLDSGTLHCLEEGFSKVTEDLCVQSRFERCHLFALSDDATRNVAKTCRALELLSGKGGMGLADRIKFYVRIDSPDDQLVLDAANTGVDSAGSARPLPIRTLMEGSLAALSLLQKAPLYQTLGNEAASPLALRPQTPQELRVVVFGSGEFAEAVTLNVLWAGQMHNVTLRVTVVDPEASAMEERLRFRCRGLFNIEELFGEEQSLFSLDFVDCSLRSPKLYDDVLLPLVGCEHLYLVSALEEGDAANHELAMGTRLFFLDQCNPNTGDLVTPTIAALVRDVSMATRVSEKLDIGSKSYGIVTFGSDLFGYDSVMGLDLERAAQRGGDIYSYLYNLNTSAFCGPQIDPEELRDSVVELLDRSIECGVESSDDISTMPQILYHSNLAQALHADYKAWAMGLDGRDGRAGEGVALPSAEVVTALAEVEHNRWWVMYLTFGYTFLDDAQQESFSRRPGNSGREKNRLRKIEEIKKHTLLSPNDWIWERYLHAMGGFSYLKRLEGVPEAGERLRLTVTDAEGQILEGIRVQLVSAGDHLVADEWVVGPNPHETPALAAGTYVVHPASALEGRQCPDDSEPISVSGAEGASEMTLPLKKSNLLVNTAVYDMAFCCWVWWERVRGQRP